MLGLPDFDKPVVAIADKRVAEISVILGKGLGNGPQHIAFCRKKLHKAEARYSAYEHELPELV